MGGGGVFRALCLVAILVIAGIECVQAAAGACGRTPPDKVALQMLPCAAAAHDPKAKVTAPCCSIIKAILKTNPRCLCAVLKSKTAKMAHVNMRAAKAIPWKCRLKTPGSC